MIVAGDFRKGSTFEKDGKVYTVVDFQHVKPGKGAAFVRTKIRDVINGGVLEITFNPSDKYPIARIETRKYEYLYFDGEFYVFMDPESYEQVTLNSDVVGDALKFLKENDTVTLKFYQGSAFSCEPENFVTLRVTSAEPGVVGNTATNVMKNAVVETGAEIMVPMFVNEGDLVRLDTRTCEYMERVKG